MSIYDDLQKKIDSIGFVDTEINSQQVKDYSAAVVGKDEYEWYNNQLYTGGDRKLRLNEYEEMNTYAEICSAMDIYADDACQRDHDGKVFQIFSENEDVQEELEDLVHKRLNADTQAWRITRGLCLYGDQYGELVMQKDKQGILFLKLLPPKTMWRIEQNGKLMGWVQEVPTGQPVHFAPFHLVHWRLPTTIHSFNPYGTSVLEAARRPWRQLKLMEDAMVVYRVTRAPERRVFKINVGNLPTAQAEQYLERYRLKFRKRSMINKNGEIDYRANTMSPDEDFYIAVRNGEDATSIETLDGAENLGEVDDVKYFKDKIFAALKIPRIFLQDTEGTEERKANVSQQDIMFARTIERIQNHVINGIKKICVVHLMLRGYPKKELDNFEITMTPPSNLSERIELEMYQERTTVADSLVEFGISRERIAEQIFNIPASEWKELRINRFKERMEEEKVDAGEWTPEGGGGEEPDVQEFGGTEGGDFEEFGGGAETTGDYQDSGGGGGDFFQFERKRMVGSIYNQLLMENELTDETKEVKRVLNKEKKILVEARNSVQK